MAERRMFAKTVIDSDSFLEMPLSSQALYFHLSMRADDDGFINNPRKILRMIGGTEDDLKVLAAKRFIIPFESGVVVIKHWKIHNYIQKDRYKETVYQDEKAMLNEKENKAYTLKNAQELPMYPKCVQDVSKVDTQDRIGKVSIGKVSIGEREEASPSPSPKTAYGIYNNVFLTDEERDSLMNRLPDKYQDLIENLSEYMQSTGKRYSDHYATICKWEREDRQKEKEKAPKNMFYQHGSKEDLDDFNRMIDEMTERLKGEGK